MYYMYLNCNLIVIAKEGVLCCGTTNRRFCHLFGVGFKIRP